MKNITNIDNTVKPLILLIGPSGSGKTTLANALSCDYGMKQLASYTDRPRRSPDEVGHTFVTKDEFNKLRPDMAAYNVFNGHQYGATYAQIDQTDIYVVDVPGYWDLMRNYHNRPFLTFVLGATSTVCARRMRRRGDSDEMVQKRLENDAKAFAGMYDLPAVRLDASCPIRRLEERISSILLQYSGNGTIHVSAPASSKTDVLKNSMISE